MKFYEPKPGETFKILGGGIFFRHHYPDPETEIDVRPLQLEPKPDCGLVKDGQPLEKIDE